MEIRQSLRRNSMQKIQMKQYQMKNQSYLLSRNQKEPPSVTNTKSNSSHNMDLKKTKFHL